MTMAAHDAKTRHSSLLGVSSWKGPPFVDMYCGGRWVSRNKMPANIPELAIIHRACRLTWPGSALAVWKASATPLRLRHGIYSVRYRLRIDGADVSRYWRGSRRGETAGNRGGTKVRMIVERYRERRMVKVNNGRVAADEREFE